MTLSSNPKLSWTIYRSNFCFLCRTWSRGAAVKPSLINYVSRLTEALQETPPHVCDRSNTTGSRILGYQTSSYTLYTEHEIETNSLIYMCHRSTHNLILGSIAFSNRVHLCSALVFDLFDNTQEYCESCRLCTFTFARLLSCLPDHLGSVFLKHSTKGWF